MARGPILGGRSYASPMRPIAAYPTQTQAEVARARLEDEGIAARVGDWSAMRELTDYRVYVLDEDVEAAAEILGVEPPEVPGPLPEWVRWAMIASTVAMVGLVVWALST